VFVVVETVSGLQLTMIDSNAESLHRVRRAWQPAISRNFDAWPIRLGPPRG